MVEDRGREDSGGEDSVVGETIVIPGGLLLSFLQVSTNEDKDKEHDEEHEGEDDVPGDETNQHLLRENSRFGAPFWCRDQEAHRVEYNKMIY